MKIEQILRPTFFKRAAFVAAAAFVCVPLQATAVTYVSPPPGEVRFWVTAIGIHPEDHVRYRVSYVAADGSRREAVQEALGAGTPLFKIPDSPRDFRIEAVRNPSRSTEKTVEYRCSKIPAARVAISFSRNHSNAGC